MSESARGLEGIVVGSTSISKVYGDEGKLIYRGIDIDALSEHASYEEVVFLLWKGRLPKRPELQELVARLAAARSVPEPVLEWIQRAPEPDSMATLRTAASMLSAFDPEAEDLGLEAAERKAVRLVAALATLVAAIGRARAGQSFVPPDTRRSHAASFLAMLTGTEPSPTAARTLDRALVLHADHGFNASTFAARVTTSTISDMHSAVVSAIGTLKGASHGGANTRVMRMLLDIEACGMEPEDWVHRALAAGQRVMGFGHRVYKVEDPRTGHLRRAATALARSRGEEKWIALSQRVERAMRETKGLYPNVDFYSASTYYMLEIPVHLYTPLFAMSRVAGWTAHIMEQIQDNRLIRPRSHYIGPTGVAYVPIDQR